MFSNGFGVIGDSVNVSVKLWLEMLVVGEMNSVLSIGSVEKLLLNSVMLVFVSCGYSNCVW